MFKILHGKVKESYDSLKDSLNKISSLQEDFAGLDFFFSDQLDNQPTRRLRELYEERFLPLHESLQEEIKNHQDLLMDLQHFPMRGIDEQQQLIMFSSVESFVFESIFNAQFITKLFEQIKREAFLKPRL